MLCILSLWHFSFGTWHIKTMFRAMPKQGLSSWELIPAYLLKSLVGLQTQLELCLYKLEAYGRATQPPPCSPLCSFLLFHHTVSTTELDKTKQNLKTGVISNADLFDHMALQVKPPAQQEGQCSDRNQRPGGKAQDTCPCAWWRRLGRSLHKHRL